MLLRSVRMRPVVEDFFFFLDLQSKDLHTFELS